MRIIGLGLEDEATESAEIKVADGNEPAADTMNTAVSNEIDLIGREMSRIMQELSDGEKDPTKRLPIEPVITAAKEAVQNSPSVLQIGSSLDLYSAQKDEITAGKRPQVSASVGEVIASSRQSPPAVWCQIRVRISLVLCLPVSCFLTSDR